MVPVVVPGVGNVFATLGGQVLRARLSWTTPMSANRVATVGMNAVSMESVPLLHHQQTPAPPSPVPVMACVHKAVACAQLPIPAAPAGKGYLT